MGAWRPAVLGTCLLAALALFLAAGCGRPETLRGAEERAAEGVLDAALGGRNAEFVSLVAPSFLEDARREMPDADDETLGKVLVAGFLEDVPFAGAVEAVYGVEVAGDRAAVHVWGTFVDEAGSEVILPEAEALRIPLVNEAGRWCLDPLDL